MATATRVLSGEQLGKLLPLIEGADSVELKLTVPGADRRSVVNALDLDPLDAQIRQVFFFDTPELTLNSHGVVPRARRIQGKGGDSVIKLRPVVPEKLPAKLRRSPDFGVEVDAMPGGYVCSASLKGKLGPADVKDCVAGRRATRKLFTKGQRAFFAEHAPEGIELDDLAVLGPINVLKLKFSPDDLARQMVAELWNYPDGSRILELSTKCRTDEAFDTAARTRTFLASRGVDLSSEQHTKTRAALAYFAKPTE